MRFHRVVLSLAALIAALSSTFPCFAQVMMPVELPDPTSQSLQQRNLKALMAIGNEVEAHKFAYPFYFSRALDVDQAKVQVADQRSIRFDLYKGQTVLEITGNYYAAYSAEMMDSEARVRETFREVILPILRIEAAHFPDDSAFADFAIEVSHHVRQKVMGVTSERPENVMLLIPVPVAQKLVDAKTDGEKQAAILEAKLFLNGAPYSLWLQDGPPSEEWRERIATVNNPVPVPSAPANANTAAAEPSVSAALLKPAEPRIFSPEALSKLQRENEDTINRMTKELDGEAHFVPYAAPNFIGFRHGAYLQLSVSTRLNAATGTSRYKLAALAFDEHISHLVRPVLTYFPDNADFDGISFSSMVHLPDGSSPLAVEFFLPFRMMRCFASYDCTGQQLLDAATVVVNGERAALDLQVAEGKN